MDLPRELVHVVLGLFDGGGPTALVAPAFDVGSHLVVAPCLFVDGLADPADVGEVLGLVHELEPARLPGSVLLGALLSEATPFPVAAAPSDVVKVAHVFSFFFLC